MSIAEHDVVVLTRDLPEHHLRAGDVGAVVHVYAAGKAFEVEVVTGAGRPLAVIHRHDAVERAVTRPHKQRVARPRPRRVDSGGTRRLDSGRDDPRFLVAEEAAIAGVRVEGTHAQTWPPADHAREQAVEQP